MRRHALKVRGGASSQSAPIYVYQTYGDEFGVTPIPNQAYEIEYVYWSVPDDLTNYNDVCVVPRRFDHIIIDGAMSYMMLFRSNDQGAAIHQQKFEDGIKAMKRVLFDDELRLNSTVLQRSTF